MLKDKEPRILAPIVDQGESIGAFACAGIVKTVHSLNGEYVEHKRLKYKSKQKGKFERYAELSEKNKIRSESLFDCADRMASIIPSGQPILVGHYSEKGDRRYREKIWNKRTQALAADKKSSYFEKKAASVGCGGISSDDPDAISKLETELSNAEASQELTKSSIKPSGIYSKKVGLIMIVFMLFFPISKLRLFKCSSCLTTWEAMELLPIHYKIVLQRCGESASASRS